MNLSLRMKQEPAESEHMEAGGAHPGRFCPHRWGGADSGFLTRPLPVAGDLDKTLQEAEGRSRCCVCYLAVGSGQGPCLLSGPAQSL